jgi:hypothetical protein
MDVEATDLLAISLGLVGTWHEPMDPPERGVRAEDAAGEDAAR